jgi:hypothetical protein
MSINFKSIDEALSQPVSNNFWIACKKNVIDYGNKYSFYGKDIFDEDLTFDISNNKVLANVSVNGSIKYLTKYRRSYEVDSIMPGVWWFKDFTKTGPYRFIIEIDGQTYELNKVNWQLKTSLLDNIFPYTELASPKVKIKLIVYAPISEDGNTRFQGVIYGIFLDNTFDKNIDISVSLSEISSDKIEYILSTKHIDIADGLTYNEKISFRLKPGEKKWLPFIISLVSRNRIFKEIKNRNSLEWLNSTWSYFRNMIGRLEMPKDKFTQEFLERTIHQCFGSIGMTGDGEIAGSNWGTYPTTAPIWMKDMYYSYLPFYIFDPELLKSGILWFLDRSIHYEGVKYKERVSHSLGNSLTPVVLSGLYYFSTGDREFFRKNPYLKFRIREILDKVLNSKHKNAWLFPSDWISDGPSIGDYHTGSNVLAWYSFKSMGKIMDKVYGDKFNASKYIDIAEKIKEDIEKHNVIDNVFGLQYIEGVDEDGSVPYMIHDGEESDVTLMPVYGYTSFDDQKYKNFSRFALTEYNKYFVPETGGVRWDNFQSIMEAKSKCKFNQKKFDWEKYFNNNPYISSATFPAFITGFASITNEEEMNGKNGYMTRIKQLADMDGSIWWWPYPNKEDNPKYEYPLRFYTAGKSGWASGVFAVLFVSEILGLKYDGLSKKLYFRPFSPSSNFKWENFRIGNGCFSVDYKKRESHISMSIENNNQFDVTVEYEIIIESNLETEKVFLNGLKYVGKIENGIFLNKKTIKISTTLNKGEKNDINIEYREK